MLVIVVLLLLIPLLKFHGKLESIPDGIEVVLNEGAKFDAFVVISKKSSFASSKEDAVIAT